MVICICHVEFTGGELRIVSEIDAFVPELTTDLIHSVHSTDHKHLLKDTMYSFNTYTFDKCKNIFN